MLILTNATIYTANPQAPRASTLVIDDAGELAHVGGPEILDQYPGYPTYDLGGGVIIPGIIDAHAHPSMVTQSMWHTRLPWTTDIDELLTFIRDHAATHPVEDAPFLYFEYYPSATFHHQPPTKELLDSAVSDRPVLCQDHSEHSHWVNSRMLELMGITADTPDPVPGLEIFERDDQGEPTGHLRETVHRHFLDTMFDNLNWRPPEQLTPDQLTPFFRFMTEHGVTGLLEAWINDEQAVASIADLDRRGELNMYYEGALRFTDLSDLPQVIDRLQHLHGRYSSDHISINTLKLFLDGTNETGNSAVLAPLCSHGTSELGAIGMDLAELTNCLALANTHAIDVHIHLVGDRAFRQACDAVATVQARCAQTGIDWVTRVTLAHCELIDPTDMARPADLGIFINWSPHWSGGYFGEESRTHLGDDRWERMYRFNEIADAGGTLTFSSDVVTGYELHRGNPFFGMQVGATRVDPEFPLDQHRYPNGTRPPLSARLSVERLLAGYTHNAAEQLGVAHKTGSLAPGKKANLNILSADPHHTDPTQLAVITCQTVIFEGRVVAGELPAQPPPQAR